MSATIRRFPMQAFGLAIVAEAALLAIVCAILLSTPFKPALSEPVPITLLSPDEPPPAPLPSPKPSQPKSRPAPTSKPQPKTRAAPARPQPQIPQQQAPAPMAPLPVAQAPTAFSEPVPPPPPPAPAPAASGKADPNAAYAAKVRAAVQAAVAYPPAAAALHFTGRVRLEFHLRDAVPGQARVVSSSGIGMIDRAALQSVQTAQYPEPPPDMRGSDHLYQVWVEFTR